MKTPRSPWVVVGAFIALVAGLNLGLRELDKHTRSPGGPVSSSFATAPNGAAAYAELLRRFDRPVLQLREPLDETFLDPRTTLVLLDPGPSVTAADGRAVRGFVEAGGRAVVGGDPTGWLGNVLDRPPEWRPDASETAQALGLAGVSVVRTAGEGAWVEPQGRTLIVADDLPVVVEQRLGRGTLALVADPSPLQNRLLGDADNAALGIALAGERPVAFAEGVHGYGPASGLGAIPARWWWVFGGLCLAAVVLALARGRRLGPAELPWRELPPARVEFAEALATQLAKARPREDGVRTARRVARARLARALGLAPEAADAELRARAAARRFDPEVLDALLGDGVGEADLLAVGRGLGSVEREEAIA
jgi:hypothetical protein